MKLKLTGFMNYAGTPIEESWVRAVLDAGLKPGDPQPARLYKMHAGPEPIIRREAKNQHGSTSYERWLDDDVYVSKVNGVFDCIFLETVARYLNDITKTYEWISFERGSGSKKHDMSLHLNFRQGDLDHTDDYMLGEGITIPTIILRERGFKLAGKDEVEMLQNALNDKSTYVDLFKLFLEKLIK